jgi:molecular chaperone HtpG
VLLFSSSFIHFEVQELFHIKVQELFLSMALYIADDIAFSILSKLPDKSLKRFSCVRKSWSRLFENSNFINMFRKNLVSKSHSLYDDNDVYHLLFQNEDNCRVLGSAINGVCCIYDSDDHTSVILGNPATEETKAIPHSSVEYQPHFTTHVVLQGFGYDYVRDDYKIIQHVSYITFNENPSDDVTHELFWEIYSLKSNTWKKFNFDIPIRGIWNNIACSDVYLNGVCHWWGQENEESYLVSYNLCNEVCISTPSPIKYVFDVDLMVFKGYVAMISNCKKTISFQISVLFELGVKESWIRVLDVEPLSGIERPIGAAMNGNIFFRKKDGGIAYFDLNTGLIKEIGIKGLDSCQLVIYKKNFVRLEN